MSFPTCRATGHLLAGWGNYQQLAVEYQRSRVEVNQDGTARSYTEAAGLFCTDDCLAAWLAEGEDAKPDPDLASLKGPDRWLPCVAKAHGYDMEPF